jgi:hypothetical protein
MLIDCTSRMLITPPALAADGAAADHRGLLT